MQTVTACIAHMIMTPCIKCHDHDHDHDHETMTMTSLDNTHPLQLHVHVHVHVHVSSFIFAPQILQKTLGGAPFPGISSGIPVVTPRRTIPIVIALVAVWIAHIILVRV